jgi:hypothetical protein
MFESQCHKFMFFHLIIQQLIVNLVDEMKENKYSRLITFNIISQFFKWNINKLFLINRLLIDLLSPNQEDLNNSHLLIMEHLKFFKVKV